MILSLLRHGSAWAALGAACAASVACSNSSNPPASAFVQATIAPTAGLNCPEPSQTSVVSIGSATGGLPTTVNDQGQGSSGTVGVTCTVHPNGNGFDIDLETDMSGGQGGSVIITSPAGQGAVTASGQSTGITAHFYGEKVLGPYEDNNCTLTYSYMGSPISSNPPVAAGRIWGHLDCPHAITTGSAAPDGGGQTGCKATADFLFQQCGQ